MRISAFTIRRGGDCEDTETDVAQEPLDPQHRNFVRVNFLTWMRHKDCGNRVQDDSEEVVENKN